MHAADDGRSFTTQEVRTFLAAAQKAETITDPLQRCLDYPDPPDSHWSHAAVSAYCRNQLVTELSFKDLKAQIEAGHADEVDRRMAALLHDQIVAGRHGVLDSTYELDFDRTSADIRPILDAWKRQSPQSAFAYAASGVAYLRAAWDARGSELAAKTPQSNFDAMARLSSLAATDLERAVTLDKRLVPAYVAMIQLGGLNNGPRYSMDAAKRALAIDPVDYLVFSRLTWLAQPKWGGSVQAMRNVITHAEPHAHENPLLILIAHQADAIAAGLDDCGCNSSVNPKVYRRIFDQVIAKNWLGGAGLGAGQMSRPALAVIYLSEALRFAPDATNYLVARSNALTQLGRYPWAIADANHAIHVDHAMKTAWTARGYAHLNAQANADAEADFRQALALVPEDPFSLWGLGTIYLREHRWDDGWNAANQLITNHPEDPDGWMLRASIQKDQPRSGLDDTIHYFLAHFGNDPAQQRVVAAMRRTLDKTGRHRVSNIR